MNDNQRNPGIENEEDDSPIISMSSLAYNKETGEVKRNLFWVRQNAESGDVEAMCNLGSAYLIGTDLDQDPEKAAYWFEKAVEEGESVAMFNLALMYAKGFGVERNFEKAAELMRKAKEAGDEDAAGPLSEFEKNAETMRKAKAGDPKEQALLGAMLLNIAEGNMLREAGPEQDYSDSLYWSWKAAKAGEPIAMNTLGILYSKGYGTAKNCEEAFNWYLQGAERGLNIAMANVAYYYIYGKGVELNPEKSAEWFVKAINSGWIDSNQDLPRVRKIIELMQVAKTGDVEAWANLADDLRGIGASLESRGDDPQKAYTESYQWAKQAAEAGHPKGMRILAAALLFGRGVEKNPEEGISILEKACEMDDPDCMTALAEAYLNGCGVERNLDYAQELLTKAKSMGNENAAILLNKLSGKDLDPDEQLNLVVRSTVIALMSGETPEQIADRFGLKLEVVSMINTIRLLRGLKQQDENIDKSLNMSTKMFFSLILSKLEKGEVPTQIANELQIPEDMICMIDQIDSFFRKK